MEQIRHVGVVEGKTEFDVGEEHIPLPVDPAMRNTEDTARIVIEHTTTGKPIVLVVSGREAGEAVKRLITELEEHDDIDDVISGIWPPERQVIRSRGVLGGFGHLPMLVLSAAHAGPNWSNACYAPDENYFDYRQRLRDEEVARGMRRPPKKAVCSSRRRGRKFRGS